MACRNSSEDQEHEIEQLITAISRVEFKCGRRDSNQYAFSIQRILRKAGFKTQLEYLMKYPEGHRYCFGRIDVYGKKGKTVICIEIDYKTPKRNSILKISRVWGAIPVFVLTFEGNPDIQESYRKIDAQKMQRFFLVDLYNQRVYSQKDKSYSQDFL